MVDLILVLCLAAVFSLSLFALLDWLGKKTEKRFKEMYETYFEPKDKKDESKESKEDQKHSKGGNSRR